MTGTAYRPESPRPSLLDRIALPLCCGIVAAVCAGMAMIAWGLW